MPWEKRDVYALEEVLPNIARDIRVSLRIIFDTGERNNDDHPLWSAGK